MKHDVENTKVVKIFWFGVIRNSFNANGENKLLLQEKVILFSYTNGKVVKFSFYLQMFTAFGYTIILILT